MSHPSLSAWRAAPLALALAACASTPPAPAVPQGAVEATRTESNGDVITEYRVAGALRMVKVTPVRGPSYYLVDKDGDGRMDRRDGEVPPVYFKLYGW